MDPTTIIVGGSVLFMGWMLFYAHRIDKVFRFRQQELKKSDLVLEEDKATGQKKAVLVPYEKLPKAEVMLRKFWVNDMRKFYAELKYQNYEILKAKRLEKERKLGLSSAQSLAARLGIGARYGIGNSNSRSNDEE
jgi:hypothetical protein